MTPPAEIFRTRLSPESLITTPPSDATATALGPFKRAAVAAAPSPHAAVGVEHATPVPATREITPPDVTFRTLLPWSSAIRNPPSGVGTAMAGLLSMALVA